MAQAETKLDALLDDINRALARHTQGAGVSEFEILRLEREARSEMDRDPSDAHLVLGGASYLRGRFDDSLHHHELSVQLADDKRRAQENFATGLANMGKLARAAEIVKSLFEADPLDKELLQKLFDFNFCSGRIIEAMNWLRYADEKFSADDAGLFRKQLKFIEDFEDDIYPFILESGLDDSVVSSVFSYAHEIRFSKGIFSHGLEVDVDRYDGEQKLNVFSFVKASVDEVLAMNFELATARSKKVSELEKLISISFRVASSNNATEAA